MGCARRAFRPGLALALRALVPRRDDTGDRHGLGRGVLSNYVGPECAPLSGHALGK